MVCTLSGEMWPLYEVERWPQIRGSLSTILNGHAVRTEVHVSVHKRHGGRTLEVVVKRGSTVTVTVTVLVMVNTTHHQHVHYIDCS